MLGCSLGRSCWVVGYYRLGVLALAVVIAFPFVLALAVVIDLAVVIALAFVLQLAVV